MNLRNCDICGGREFQIIEKTELFEEANNSSITVNLVKCKACGLVFINPDFDRKFLQYSMNYYSSFGKVTDNFYRSLIARQIIKFKRTSGKMLEVGCGEGSLLVTMKESGWTVFGTDISDSGVKLSKNKLGCDSVFQGYLIEANFPDLWFDAICLRHVLEHVDKPVEEFLEIRRILENSGILCIVVPNIESLNFRVFRKNWFHLDIPRHSHLYSLDTLTKLAFKTGFKLTKTSASPEDPLDWFRSFCNVVKVNKRVPFFLLPALSTIAAISMPFTFLLSRINMGSTVQCYFQKNLAFKPA